MRSERDLPVEGDYKDFGSGPRMLQPELVDTHGGGVPRSLSLSPPPGQSSLVVEDDPLGEEMALEIPDGRAVVHFPPQDQPSNAADGR